MELHGKGYFDGNPEEGCESDPMSGEPLKLSAEEMADNEDDLIQLCHKVWLDGEEEEYAYSKIDLDSKWDDEKTLH